jgi:hypothetical protein
MNHALPPLYSVRPSVLIKPQDNADNAAPTPAYVPTSITVTTAMVQAVLDKHPTLCLFGFFDPTTLGTPADVASHATQRAFMTHPQALQEIAFVLEYMSHVMMLPPLNTIENLHKMQKASNIWRQVVSGKHHPVYTYHKISDKYIGLGIVAALLVGYTHYTDSDGHGVLATPTTTTTLLHAPTKHMPIHWDDFFVNHVNSAVRGAGSAEWVSLFLHNAPKMRDGWREVTYGTTALVWGKPMTFAHPDIRVEDQQQSVVLFVTAASDEQIAALESKWGAAPAWVNTLRSYGPSI